MLSDERCSFCITFTPTTYATNDTTIIHHIYNPDFSICVPLSTTGNWDLFAIKSAAVFGLVFFQVNGNNGFGSQHMRKCSPLWGASACALSARTFSVSEHGSNH